jgi:formate dehydrogenase subunit delta
LDNDKLATMANQITTFFRPYPEEDAVKGIAEHITAFWTPGMRRALEARIAGSHDGVDRLVILAVTAPQLAAAGESPIKKEIAGPEVVGEMASDAG